MQNTTIVRADRGCRPGILACAIALALIAGPVQVHAQAPAYSAQTSFDIPAQPAGEAFNAFARQSGWRILFPYDAVEGKRTHSIRGAMSNEEALNRLLADTGLIVASREDGVITLCVGEGGRCAGAQPRQDQSGTVQSSIPTGSVEDLGSIVVTGTRVRGAEVSSPLVTMTQEEMRLSGHSNLGEAIRALPQNFSGGQNPGVLVGGSDGLTNQNVTGGSSLNLRGLGPDATLTLLNGARLPYDGFFQATDVSMIPVAAIDRIEVLLDGASAIYGADAVGGVANIILKRNHQGLLPQVRVAPELRAELEAVLREGETLSGFVEASVRGAVEYRRVQDAFHARGEAAWQAYQRTGVSRPADEVLAGLQARLDARRKQLKPRS